MAGYRWRANQRLSSAVAILKPPTPRYRVVTKVDPPVEDCPGYNLKPDLSTVATVSDFVDALSWLHVWAGNPGLRELSRRCGGSPSHTTFANLLKAEKKLPALDLVLVFVDALGLSADRDEWAAVWRRLATVPGPRMDPGVDSAS